MPSATNPPGGERERGAAASARDAGVHRVRRLTRWMTTGALALTGVFAGLAAHATAHAKHRTTTRAAVPPPSAPSTQTNTEPYGGDGSSDSGTYGSDGYGDGSSSGESSGSTGESSGSTGESSGGSGDSSGSSGGYSYGDSSAAPQAPAQAPQQTYSPPAASSGAS